jgi:hypothetical protein
MVETSRFFTRKALLQTKQRWRSCGHTMSPHPANIGVVIAVIAATPSMAISFAFARNRI